jgi:glutathione S-transferase
VNREAARENAPMETYVRQIITYSPQDESSDIATYLREHGGNAIGHVIRDREGRPHINPDDPTARARLAAEAWWLRAASRTSSRQVAKWRHRRGSQLSRVVQGKSWRVRWIVRELRMPLARRTTCSPW